MYGTKYNIKYLYSMFKQMTEDNSSYFVPFPISFFFLQSKKVDLNETRSINWIIFTLDVHTKQVPYYRG